MKNLITGSKSLFVGYTWLYVLGSRISVTNVTFVQVVQVVVSAKAVFCLFWELLRAASQFEKVIFAEETTDNVNIKHGLYLEL